MLSNYVILIQLFILFVKIDFQFCDVIMLFVSDALVDYFVNGV